MCNPRRSQVCCLAAFFTYQFAMMYLWLMFILTTNLDMELIYCPSGLTGRITPFSLHNNTDE